MNAADGSLSANLRGHTSDVFDAEFSPDGHRIVTAGFDNVAIIWNWSQGDVLTKLIGHSRNIWSASFSRDGRRVVTATWDGLRECGMQMVDSC